MNTEPTERSKNRRVRRVSLATLLAALAIATFAAVRWDVVWGAGPGRIGAPDATIPIQVLASEDQPEVRLAVLGDVGTGDANERATADLVTHAAKSQPFDGLVLLGDNVYPNGDPQRLNATVFEPFATILDQGTALLPVLGNHDIQDGHASGQVDALGMPGRWYSTNIGPALVIGLDSNLVDDPTQTAWLDATLAANSQQWVIVAMHHPAYSAGYHGSDDDIQETWVPIFEQHGVDLVLAGHDHDYQRTTPIGGVTYIVSGGGAKTRPTARADYTAYAASVLHFLDVTIWNDRLEITAISADGAFDHVTIDQDYESTTAALSVEPAAQQMSLSGLDFDDIAAGLIAGLGASLWVLSLSIGWFGPPPIAARYEHILQIGTTSGWITMMAGVARALTTTLH